MTTLSDYLARLSESLSAHKSHRLAKLVSQTSDPTHIVLDALLTRDPLLRKSSNANTGGLDRDYVETLVHRKSVGLGLTEEWRGIVTERIWAGLMEESECLVEA